MDIYNIFDQFLTRYNLYPNPIPNLPGYQADQFGNIYDTNGHIIQPYQYRDSNQYDMIYVRDINNKPRLYGVHQLVAMTFLDGYYPGCVVHHIDENKYNNRIDNLEITNRSDHCKHHNPGLYQDIMKTCDVCGKQFIWTAKRQKQYHSDIRRGLVRYITCSPSCASYLGRMKQLGHI